MITLKKPPAIPFVPGLLSRGTRGLELLKDCPHCGETMVCRELKDEESFTGREFAEHYLAHFHWRLADCCDECGSDDEFLYPKAVEVSSGAFCSGCVGIDRSDRV